MADTVTVTVSIGRNVGDQPMPENRWQDFRDGISGYLARFADVVYVDAAHSVGEWDGILEDSATYVAAVPAANVNGLRACLVLDCWQYGQDAIALTIGETELVSR
jgi:hypothetical protein